MCKPLFTLVYPLYASIRAIESDSHSENQKWLSYWVLCGLIMLFELTTTKLFEWIPFWSKIKLIVAFWLVVPQFDGAVYAYNNFLRPCFSLNPKALGHLLRSPKHDQLRIGNSKDFLLVAEKHVQENGPEALGELIFGKIKYIKPNPTVEKDSVTSIIKKDDEDAKKRNKMDSPFAQTDYKEIAGTENKAMILVEVVGGGSVLSQSSLPDEDKMEWTCALCQVSTHSEAVQQNHLHGKKHKANVENLIKSSLPRTDSKEIAPTGVLGGGSKLSRSSLANEAKKVWTCPLCQVSTYREAGLRKHLKGKKHRDNKKKLMESSLDRTDSREIAPSGVLGGGCKFPELSTLSNVQNEWTCALCEICTPSEDILHKHLQGKKHKAKENELMEKQMERRNNIPFASTSSSNKLKVTPKKGIAAMPNVPHFNRNKLKVTQNEGILGEYVKKPEEKRVGGTVISGRCPQSSPPNTKIGSKSSELWCDVYQLQCSSSSRLFDHLRGKTHLASEQGELQFREFMVG